MVDLGTLGPGYSGRVTPTDPAPEQRATPLGQSAPVDPLTVPTRTIVLVGTAIWAVALIVTLLVPDLHTGERSWWPWACVSGLGLGAFAWWYANRTQGVDDPT